MEGYCMMKYKQKIECEKCCKVHYKNTIIRKECQKKSGFVII